MRKLACLVLVLLGLGIGSGAQSLDLALGAGSAAGGHVQYGFWPSASATVMVSKHVGLNADFAARATNYSSFGLGQYRPSTMDFNLVMRANPMRWTPEVQIGYAAVRTSSGIGCDVFFPGVPCYGDPSQRQSALHLGGGIKSYFAPRWFVRFEAHWFARPAINGFSFSTFRFGASIGYTFGKP